MYFHSYGLAMIGSVSPAAVFLIEMFTALFGFLISSYFLAAVTELVGVDYRRTVGVSYQMFFSIGLLVLPLLAYLIPNWRWLQVVFTVPYIFFLTYYW